MVTKKLPRYVLKRLKHAAPKLEEFMSHLKNMDPRAEVYGHLRDRNLTPAMLGGRVRGLQIRGAVGLRHHMVVLKRVHGLVPDVDTNALTLPEKRVLEEEVKTIRYAGSEPVGEGTRPITAIEVVKFVNHNVDKLKYFPHPAYRVKKPLLYPLSDKLIAMSYTRLPTLDEMLGEEFRPEMRQTPRGKRFLDKLLRDHGLGRKELLEAIKHLEQNSELRAHNLFIGYQDGKLLFIPAADLF